MSLSAKRESLARKLRVVYPGAIYHTMNRGDRREPTFKDDADRQRFVETLGEAGVRAHAIRAVDCFNAMLKADVPNLEMLLYGRGGQAGDRKNR